MKHKRNYTVEVYLFIYLFSFSESETESWFDTGGRLEVEIFMPCIYISSW